MNFLSRYFRFSWKITLTCTLLAIGMIRLAFWQESRHIEKLEIIKKLDANLALEIVPLSTLLSTTDWNPLIHRRVTVSGDYDFPHEMALRNRRLNLYSGVHAITPLRISGTESYVLVDRGFVPLTKSDREARKEFQKSSHVELTGLIKESAYKKLFSPDDPEVGPGLPWADQWLRVNVPRMAEQLPYKVLPVYLEIMEATDPADAKKKIVASKSDGMQEILFLPNRGKDAMVGMETPDLNYPVPSFTTMVPAGRHREYVYHWSFMALVTLGIGGVLQMRRGIF